MRTEGNLKEIWIYIRSYKEFSIKANERKMTCAFLQPGWEIHSASSDIIAIAWETAEVCHKRRTTCHAALALGFPWVGLPSGAAALSLPELEVMGKPWWWCWPPQDQYEMEDNGRLIFFFVFPPLFPFSTYTRCNVMYIHSLGQEPYHPLFPLQCLDFFLVWWFGSAPNQFEPEPNLSPN